MSKKKVEEKKKIKYEKIIEAAIELFSIKGFHKTRTYEVAKKAGVAEGTIYLYFNSKDELLINAYKKVLSDLIYRIQQKNKEELVAICKIRNFIDEHMQVLKDNETLARFIIVESRQSPQFYNKYPKFRPLNDYVEYLKSIIKEAIDNNEIRPTDCDIFASIIYGTIDVILTRWFLLRDINDLDQLTDTVMDIVYNGLAKTKVPQQS